LDGIQNLVGQKAFLFYRVYWIILKKPHWVGRGIVFGYLPNGLLLNLLHTAFP
jgi:hypothetical protein